MNPEFTSGKLKLYSETFEIFGFHFLCFECFIEAPYGEGGGMTSVQPTS